MRQTTRHPTNPAPITPICASGLLANYQADKLTMRVIMLVASHLMRSGKL